MSPRMTCKGPIGGQKISFEFEFEGEPRAWWQYAGDGCQDTARPHAGLTDQSPQNVQGFSFLATSSSPYVVYVKCTLSVTLSVR